MLKQAKKYLSARQFQKVISLLEPKVLEYRDDFVFYKYLAFAYLYLGDYGGAEAYVRRARHLSSDDPEVGMALAALFLRRREFTKALQIWLEIRSQFPEHKGARRALELAKKAQTTEGDYLLDTRKFQVFLPALPRRFPILPILSLMAGLMLASSVALVFFNPPEWLQDLLRPSPSAAQTRPKVEVITLDTDQALIQQQGDFQYYFENREIRQIFEEAKRYFVEYRDNLAILQVNRLLASNASPLVKEKALLMKSHAVTPTFLDFRDNFSYGAVSEDPLPYADVHVLWSGRIAALEVEEQIRFDLLVGYENFQFSEGILPIVLDFPALLENGQAVEVIGQVKINQNGGFFLQGKSVRDIAPDQL